MLPCQAHAPAVTEARTMTQQQQQGWQNTAQHVACIALLWMFGG
jgi:hypothetical protein